MTLIYIVVAAGFIMSASLAGALFAPESSRRFLERNKGFLTAFAVGVFFVTTIVLSMEAIHSGTHLLLLAGAAIAGFFLVRRLVPSKHHHSSECNLEHSSERANRFLLCGGICHISDGIILVPAFMAGPHIGVLATVGIFAHEFLQAIGEFGFLHEEAGYTIPQALLRSLLFSSTIIIGIALAYFASTLGVVDGFLLAFAAGGFANTLCDSLPDIAKSVQKSGRIHARFAAFALGITLMVVVQLLVASTHSHHAHAEDAEHSHVEEEHEEHAHD